MNHEYMGSTGAPAAAWQGPEDREEISQQPIQQTASHTEIRTPPADAVLDFTAFGGPKGSPTELQAYFGPILSSLASSQHTVSTVKIDLTGDSATARSAAIVPMTARTPEGKESTFVSGLWYEDALIRCESGWKIKERKQVRGWAASLT